MTSRRGVLRPIGRPRLRCRACAPPADRRPAAAILALALALATVGCYSFAEPSLRPGDSLDVMAALARHGAVVTDIVAGESACDDPGLIANALHLVATAPTTRPARRLHLPVPRAAAGRTAQQAVDACQDAYADRLDGGDAGRARGRADVSGVRGGLVERPDRGDHGCARGGLDEGRVSDARPIRPQPPQPALPRGARPARGAGAARPRPAPRGRRPRDRPRAGRRRSRSWRPGWLASVSAARMARDALQAVEATGVAESSRRRPSSWPGSRTATATTASSRS